MYYPTRNYIRASGPLGSEYCGKMVPHPAATARALPENFPEVSVG